MYSQKQIINIAHKIMRKYRTYDPFDLADYLHIEIIKRPLGNIWGFYILIRRNKQIYINSEIEYIKQKFTCSHELGHAVLHPKENCPFMRSSTLFTINKLEVEANTFAACLMFPTADGELYTSEQVAAALNVAEAPVLYEVACTKAIF